MKYYGIVNSIKKEHKSGIYGRKKPDKEELEDIIKNSLNFDWKESLLVLSSVISPHIRVATLIYWGAQQIQKINKKNPIKLAAEIESKNKILIIPSDLINKDYRLDSDISYGLLDDFTSKEKANAFKTIMTSKGGSSLNIIERNDLPSDLKHFGGENGKFSEGLYIGHPKNGNLLIPLREFRHLVQTLILEETIRAYEALGAKKILIEDITEIGGAAGGKVKNVELNSEANYSKEILRIKEYGTGTFDVERAINEKLFLHDIPAVMSTIDARINGNQTIDEFTETINLSIGLDTNVLDLFKENNSFTYHRKWHFKVEFYDKNEIVNIQ